MPVRKSFFAENATPCDNVAGTGAILRQRAPRIMAINKALTPGSRCAPNDASNAPAKHTATPGITTFTWCSCERSAPVWSTEGFCSGVLFAAKLECLLGLISLSLPGFIAVGYPKFYQHGYMLMI